MVNETLTLEGLSTRGHRGGGRFYGCGSQEITVEGQRVTTALATIRMKRHQLYVTLETRGPKVRRR